MSKELLKIRFVEDDKIIERSEEEIPLIHVCYEEATSINFGCRIGMCGTCKINVVSGLENLNPKNEEEKFLTEDESERLACQCIVKGDIEIE